MSQTQPMRLRNGTFLIERLAADCAPDQWKRELTLARELRPQVLLLAHGEPVVSGGGAALERFSREGESAEF
jgi:hypothetical protein